MKKIKIFVITAFWPYGALSTRIKKFYPKLAKYKEFDITLTTNYNTLEEKKYLEENLKGVRLNLIKVPNKRPLKGIMFSLKTYLKGFQSQDLIIVHFTSYAIMLLPKLNEKFIIHTHGADVNIYMKRGIYRFLSKMAYNRAGNILCPSESEKKKISSMGIDQKKINFIRTGIDLNDFSSKKINYYRNKLRIKDKYILSFVGHISYAKGIDFLLEALPELMKQDVTIVLAGNISDEKNSLNKESIKVEKESLIQRVKKSQKGYDGRFFWLGEIDIKEVKKLLQSSDFFILPSRSEASTSIALLEAMASGNVCIATDVGDIKKLLSDCCYIIPPENSEQIVKAIKDLINHPKKRQKLLKNTKKRLSYFRWDNIVKEHANLYLRLYKEQNNSN
jgi:glycosyltransferase involved in cell wall biosynthesis